MRFLTSLSLLIAFAVTAIALTVTTPAANDKVDLSKPFTIKWMSVSPDPDRFTIYLVNVNRNVNKKIAEDVKSSKSSYALDAVWGVPVANGYQFNFVSNTKDNTGILAQSQQFNLTKVADGPPKTETATATATESTSTPTPTNAGSKALTIPVAIAGTFIMTLAALAL